MAATTSAHEQRAGRSPRWGTGVVLVALATLTLADCGSPGGGDKAPAPVPRTTGPPSARLSVKPSVSAADGRDVSACADGDCEIGVSEPVTLRFRGPDGPAALSVTEVGPNKVEYTVKSGTSQSEGGATGPGQGCVTVLRSGGSSNSCGALGDGARPSPQPHAVVIQAATGEDGTAILQIVSG